jgi:cell division protein FtsB
MKILAAALVVVLTLLQYRLWLGEGGMREVRRLQVEIQAQHDETQQLKERNRTLSAEVLDLKKGTVAIEERARTDLGMVGKGETFYQVVPPSASVAPEPSQPAVEPYDERRVIEARAPTRSVQR